MTKEDVKKFFKERKCAIIAGAFAGIGCYIGWKVGYSKGMDDLESHFKEAMAKRCCSLELKNVITPRDLMDEATIARTIEHGAKEFLDKPIKAVDFWFNE